MTLRICQRIGGRHEGAAICGGWRGIVWLCGGWHLFGQHSIVGDVGVVIGRLLQGSSMVQKGS